MECQRIVARRVVPSGIEYARLRVGKVRSERTVRVLGALLGPEATGHGALRFAGCPVDVVSVSRAWPKPCPHPLSVWTGVGACGGCDGVVVWELHSGREHLVSQGLRFLVRISNFL